MWNNIKKKGFTIIESLVTIFFVSVGITGVLIAIQQTMAYIDFLFPRLTAIYLTQEGIEIVRNIRDTNWLKDRTVVTAWDNGLEVGQWEVDYRDQELTDGYDGDFLLIDGGFYNYSSGTSTSFRREIIIEKPDPDQMRVTAIVRWTANGEHQISAEEILYNWKE